MGLSAIHDKIDDIPEPFRELYTEKNGKWELTGIAGVKTEADVARVNEGLRKEKEDHKVTKAKLSAWGDLNHDDVVAKLDKLPELEAAAKGKLDDAKIEEIVARRVDGTIKSKLSPIERENKQLREKLNETAEVNAKLTLNERNRRIGDKLTEAMVELKVVPEAYDDAHRLARDVFEVTQEGTVVTRDGAGVTVGLDPKSLLLELQPKRPHWWPTTQGGGSRGSGPNGSVGKNPWAHDTWDMTAQAAFFTQHGEDRASAMAKAAGTELGGMKPSPKK